MVFLLLSVPIPGAGGGGGPPGGGGGGGPDPLNIGGGGGGGGTPPPGAVLAFKSFSSKLKSSYSPKMRNYEYYRNTR